MILTAQQLAAALPMTLQRAQTWVDHINAATERFGIDDAMETAAFLAQVGHESNHLADVQENLMYSAAGLLLVFPKYFDEASAQIYARQSQKIANRVYANRMGNGDEASGDGWKYRGRGLIQITGKSNYTICGSDLGLNLVDQPDQLIEPHNAAASAAWFWHARRLGDLAHDGDIRNETRVINGGLNGLPDRQQLYEQACKALGVTP
jgi:putative chitinase